MRSLRKNGFTLLELLVVIAIIAVLFALSSVVYSTWRGRAKALACTENLRRIAVAFASYAADNNGTYPLGGDPNAERDFESAWSAILVAGRYLPEPEDPKTAVFLCPFDPAADDPYPHVHRSYSCNAPHPAEEPIYPNRVTNPGRTILLAEWYDPDPYSGTDSERIYDSDGWAWRRSGGIYGHHADGRSNVLFYDLHVEAIKEVPDLPAPGVSVKWSFEESD